MANRDGNDNFMYNSMLASALAHLLSCQERKIIRLWLDKLQAVTEPNQMQMRNDYMWFLLTILQKKRITLPFCSAPFIGDLVPLRDALPSGVYEEVANDNAEANLAWVDQVMAKEAPDFPTQMKAPPAEFLRNQPRPQSGVMCYMGAFSDQQK